MSSMLEKVRDGGKKVASPRGLVPAGADDFVYEEYLVRLHLRDDANPTGQIARLALAAASDPRFQAFLKIALSDKGKTMHLATIAKMCEIGLVEFQALWRDARINQAINKAIDSLTAITTDMIDDAMSNEATCSSCDGTGQVEREGKPAKICPNCSGKGTVRTIGDKHARNKLLEMTGAIKKEPAVQVSVDLRGQGLAAASARLSKAVPMELDDSDDSAIDVESESA